MGLLVVLYLNLPAVENCRGWYSRAGWLRAPFWTRDLLEILLFWDYCIFTGILTKKIILKSRKPTLRTTEWKYLPGDLRFDLKYVQVCPQHFKQNLLSTYFCISRSTLSAFLWCSILVSYWASFSFFTKINAVAFRQTAQKAAYFRFPTSCFRLASVISVLPSLHLPFLRKWKPALQKPWQISLAPSYSHILKVISLM